MDEIFNPQSVAVIGVSPRADNLGRNIVANLVEFGFNGVVYAVGPSGGAIETRRIYRSIGEIPDKVDLAVILTPARTVPEILEECGQKGVRWAIIETAGFREYGEAGRQLEQQMMEVARRYGMRFVGPNCIGVMNMANGFCVPFLRLKKLGQTGRGFDDLAKRRGWVERTEPDGQRGHWAQQIRLSRQYAGYHRRRFAGIPGGRPEHKGDLHLPGKPARRQAPDGDRAPFFQTDPGIQIQYRQTWAARSRHRIPPRSPATTR